jgi:hypothetical protein
MVGFRPLNQGQREQAGDARLLLESAAHNVAIVAKQGVDLDPDRMQALENAAAQAAQAAGTLRRLVRELKAR